MTFHRKYTFPLAALTVAGLMAAGSGTVSRLAAQTPDAPVPPPRDTGAGPRPRPADDRRPGPPRPEEGGPESRPDTPPVDPGSAPAAVKTAADAAAGLTPGEVWMKAAPRGELHVQATILFQNKEVARLEFDPVTGDLWPRGFHPLPQPPGTAAGPNPRTSMEPPPDTRGVSAPILDKVKAQLPGILRELTIAQGAEVMGREGAWKIPLIFQNRVVGELRVSGDGRRVMQDSGPAREPAAPGGL